MQLSAGEAISSLLGTEVGGGWEWRISQSNTLNAAKGQLLLWDVLRWPTATGGDSTSPSVPRQTALCHFKCLPG